MDKIIDKNKIHTVYLEKQKEEVDNFETRVKTLKADVSANDQSASQSEERTAGDMELLRNYEKELNFSRMEMTSLQSLNPAVAHTKVEPGAIVVTNQLNFYISIPMEKIEIDGETFIGISVKAPIYAAMQDKKKGDTFSFNETKYTILDLH